MSKKLPPSKERKTAFHGTTKDEVCEISFTFDSETQGISIAEADPDSLRTQVYYERESGKDKVLLSVPARSDVSAFDPWDQIASQCSYLIAIDTNTRIVDGRKISVSLACALPGELHALPNRIDLQPLCCYAIFEVASGINPECVGWHLLLTKHILPTRLTSKKTVGIVVDSELGLHQKINARSHPYYDHHFLPPLTSLIYASADGKTNSLPSEMLRYCDAVSAQTFDDLPQLGRQANPTNGDKNFAGYIRLGHERV
jgi:hypothetical protein